MGFACRMVRLFDVSRLDSSSVNAWGTFNGPCWIQLMLPLWLTFSRRYVFSRHTFYHPTTVVPSSKVWVRYLLLQRVPQQQHSKLCKAYDDGNKRMVREASQPFE